MVRLRETKNGLSSVIASGSDAKEGEGRTDVAQLAYAIGEATVGTKKSKKKARSDFRPKVLNHQSSKT